MEDKLKKLLEDHEGRKKTVYKCTAGKRSIGVGHNIDAKGLPDDIESFLEDEGYITDDMIDELLIMDIDDAESDARKLYPDFGSFTTDRKIALIDFVFNVGYGTAKTFLNTNKAINRGDWEKAAEGLLNSKYARQVGKRAKDLAKILKEG